MTIPGFRFTIIAVQHRFGVLLIRMHLNGQSFLRVNQFHQKTNLRAKRLQMCFPEESLPGLSEQIEQIRLIRHADHAAQPFNQIFSARIDGPGVVLAAQSSGKKPCSAFLPCHSFSLAPPT